MSEYSVAKHLVPGITIMARHFREASMSSLDSWSSERGAHHAIDLPREVCFHPPLSTSSYCTAVTPTELVLQQTAERLQSGPHYYKQQQDYDTNGGDEDDPLALARPQILACSSPEIRALCSEEDNVLYMSDVHLPTSTDSFKVHRSDIETHELKDEHLNDLERKLSLGKVRLLRGESSATSSTSATTQTTLLQLLQQPNQRHSEGPKRKPSLHRRISVSALPTMEQILSSTPSLPRPTHQKTQSAQNFTSQCRRQQHHGREYLS